MFELDGPSQQQQEYVNPWLNVPSLSCGYTALMYAIYSKSTPTIKFLLQQGADSQYVAPDGHNSITLACMVGCETEILDILMEEEHEYIRYMDMDTDTDSPVTIPLYDAEVIRPSSSPCSSPSSSLRRQVHGYYPIEWTVLNKHFFTFVHLITNYLDEIVHTSSKRLYKLIKKDKRFLEYILRMHLQQRSRLFPPEIWQKKKNKGFEKPPLHPQTQPPRQSIMNS